MKDKKFILQMIGFGLLCIFLISYFVAHAIWGLDGGLAWWLIAIIVVGVPIAILAPLADSKEKPTVNIKVTNKTIETTNTTKSVSKSKTKVKKNKSSYKQEMENFERAAFWINVLDDDDIK